MKMKQGDLLPDLEITCTDDDEEIDFTDADVRVVAVQGVDQVFTDDAPAIDGGKVTHHWQPGETDTVGRIFVNVVAEWADKQQTFPPYGSLAVDITPAEVI